MARRVNRQQRPRRRSSKAVIALSVALPVAILALWVGAHRIPWLGPLLAEGLRAVIGVEAVARLEEIAYGLQDRWNRYWRSGETPRALWAVPSPATTPGVPAPSSEPPDRDRPFRLDDVGPVHASWSAPGDGAWVAVPDARRPDDSPRLLKTLLHPDSSRSWSAVVIVAVDLRQVDLHAVAGWDEPKNGTREAFGYARPAVIPAEAQPDLLGAFNGGFRAEHGHYGMRVDGVTLLNPRRFACVLLKEHDRRISIGDWEPNKDAAARATWWRQTPPCMLEGGKLHPGLASEANTYWGATLKGETIIRRSAVGLRADRDVLYMGIGDHTTARAIAAAMKHAGAADVAQLDVNWSYPRFVLYEPRTPGSADLVARPLTDGFECSEDEFVRERSPRDFFYLTRKSS